VRLPLRLGTGFLPAVRPRLVAADLDGTLLPLHGEPSSEMAVALAALAASGVRVVICTGRMFQSARRVAALLGIVDGTVVCYQGALVADLADGRQLRHRPVPASVAAAVVRFARARNRHVNAFVDDQLHVERLDAWTRLYVQRTGVDYILDDDLEHLVQSTAPDKLLLMTAAADAVSLLPELRERWKDELAISLSQPGYVEITASTATKRSALEFLGRHWGVGRAHSVACGDGMNDVDMLEWAGFAVAMAEGARCVWQAADVVMPQTELASFLLRLSALPWERACDAGEPPAGP